MLQWYNEEVAGIQNHRIHDKFSVKCSLHPLHSFFFFINYSKCYNLLMHQYHHPGDDTKLSLLDGEEFIWWITTSLRALERTEAGRWGGSILFLRSLAAWASGFYLRAKHLAGKLTEESAFQISLTYCTMFWTKYYSVSIFQDHSELWGGILLKYLNEII